MQQVGKGSRFWWRALDAHAPQPVTPSPPHPSFQHATPHQAIPAPAEPFTLSIPPSERRGARKPRRSRVRILARSAATLTLIATASAAVAVFLPQRTWQEVREDVAVFADKALIAGGFGIDQVSLSGQRYTLDSDVFDALDLANVRTFAALDTKAVLHRIERVSWVDTAQLTRIFPGKLNIEITERRPAAIWTRGDTTYLIDATGRTLGPLPQGSGWVLPRVAGEGANVDTPLLLAALGRHKEIESEFNFAERVAERRWRVVLNNGTRIELAADREFEGLEIVAANRTLHRSISGPPVVIDVRTAGRATVRPLAARASLTGQTPQITATVTP